VPHTNFAKQHGDAPFDVFMVHAAPQPGYKVISLPARDALRSKTHLRFLGAPDDPWPAGPLRLGVKGRLAD